MIEGMVARRLQPIQYLSSRMTARLPSWILRRFALSGFCLPHALRPLSATIPDLWSGDETRANAIFRGHYDFGGHRIVSPRQAPWNAGEPAEAWSRAFHRCEWLRDFRAAEGKTHADSAARRQARAMIAAWLDRYAHSTAPPRPPYDPIWEDLTLAARTRAWSIHAAWILDGADGAFQRGFLLALRRHLAECETRRLAEGSGFAALEMRFALLVCALAFAGFERRWPRLMVTYLRAVQDFVEADGWPKTRRADDAADLLDDLLQLQTALKARLLPQPDTLALMIDRITPALRTLRHGDGSAAHLGGGADVCPERIEALMKKSGVAAKAMPSLPYSGLSRAMAKRALVLFDTGAPVPGHGAHASVLAFEFSHGKDRIVVNCGAPRHASPARKQAFAATAAHSSLTIADASAKLHHAPRLERHEEAGQTWFEASHDGYAAYGLRHHRRLYLAASGDELRGADALEAIEANHAPSSLPFDLRFHLDPSVEASLAQDGATVWLKTASRQGWRFRASGGQVGLEETCIHDCDGHPRRSLQIVVSGEINPLAEPIMSVRWAFQRQTQPSAALS